MKFGGAVAKILKVWLEAPEVWDVVTYMTDLEKQLNESIAENEQRKKEEAERKAHERKEKKKGREDKDVTQREGKGEASASAATSDGDSSSKSQVKKTKKQASQAETVADPEGRPDELKQEETDKSSEVVSEEDEQSRDKTESVANLVEASRECEKEELEMHSPVDEEYECIAPTARLFKDWRPPSPEHDTVSEPPFWKKKDEFGRPLFPFLGFHEDPDELDMKTSDTSTDSNSPSGSVALPDILLGDGIASSRSETNQLEGKESSDRQEVQEKQLESSDVREEDTIAGLPCTEDLEQKADGNEQRIDRDCDESLVEKVKGYPLESSKMPLYTEELKPKLVDQGIALRKPSPTESNDEQQSEAATVSDSQTPSEKKAAVVDCQEMVLSVADVPVELPLVCSALYVKQIDYDEPPPPEGAGKTEDVKEDVKVDGGCDVQEIILELQRGEESTYLVTSQAKRDGLPIVANYLSSNTSGHKYHGTFMTPRGGRVHVSRDLVELVGNIPRYSFELCVEMPAIMMPVGSYDDGGGGKNLQKFPDEDVTSSVSEMLYIATELARVDMKHIGARLLTAEEGSDGEEKRSFGGSQQFVDRLVRGVIEAVTVLGPMSEEGTKKQRMVKVNAESIMKTTGDATKVTDGAVKEIGGTVKATEDYVQVSGESMKASLASAEASKAKTESSSSSEPHTEKSVEVLETDHKKEMSLEPDKVHEAAKDGATGAVKDEASLPTSHPVETVPQQKKQAAQAKRAEPVLNEFSGGAGWIKSFCKGEPISKFDGHFRQSVFLRNINPEHLLGKMKSKQGTVQASMPSQQQAAMQAALQAAFQASVPKPKAAAAPKRQFLPLTEGKLSDASIREFMRRSTGGVFFVTRIGTYSLLKNPKWASFYAAYVCSHTCHSDKEMWKAHPETWEAAEKRVASSTEPAEEVTGGYYNSVFTSHDRLNIPVVYCYLDWNLEMVPDLQLPRDADKISAMRFVFISPRGNGHALDFIKKFMKVGEPKVVDTILFPTHAAASKRGGCLERLPVDPVDRPSSISAYSAVKTTGDVNLLELLQEKMVGMAASTTTVLAGMDLAQFRMEKDSLPKGTMEMMKSATGRQILSGLFSAVVKKQQEKRGQATAAPELDAGALLPSEQPTATKAIAASTEKKTGAKRKGKGKRRVEVEDPTEQLRTCACCGKGEKTLKSFKKCKL